MNMKFDVVFGDQRDVHRVYRHFCLPQINIALSILVVHILNSISVLLTLYEKKYCIPFSMSIF